MTNALAGVLLASPRPTSCSSAAISEPAGRTSRGRRPPRRRSTTAGSSRARSASPRCRRRRQPSRVAVTYVDRAGSERYGFAIVPMNTPGVEFHDDWDALGMRASASGSVSFNDVHLGPDAVRDGFPTGTYSVAMFDRYLASGAFHAAASLGIAEAAHSRIVATLSQKAEQVAADTHAAMRLSENVIDLATMRAVFDRSAYDDRRLPRHVPGRRRTVRRRAGSVRRGAGGQGPRSTRPRRGSRTGRWHSAAAPAT